MTRPFSALKPLVAYVESCCTQARVLLLGQADSPLIPLILERGARLLHVCDPDPARRAEAQARSSSRQLSFGSLDDGPATLRDGFFDLALLENLAGEASPKATLANVARLLMPRGVALIAIPNPDAEQPLLASSPGRTPLDYYALYDAAIAVWPEVRMLGQVPFVGYAVVDFAGEGEPSPVLDTSLLPTTGEEPDYFVALAGRERRQLDAYAVIQLPLASVRQEGGLNAPVVVAPPPPVVAPPPLVVAPPPLVVAPPPPVTAAPPAVNAAAAAAAEAAERELRELRSRLAKQEKWIAELESRASTADERADASESELDELREQFAAGSSQWQAEHTALEAQRDALKHELGERQRELGERQRERGALEGERDALRASQVRTSSERDALKAELTSLRELADGLRESLGQKERQLQASLEGEEVAREQERLEAQLRERGVRITQLERELFEGERIGKELLRRVGELGHASGSPRLSERLAEAEAELLSLRWSLELARKPQNGANSAS